MKVEFHHGDCLEVLRTLPAASVDAVVTDPPYGLSFMGKRWDYDVPSVEIWAECLRVLKPGGHLLAFAGTRTQHRMAVRIEDAGFEIRDMIAWVYGSGFPKSLDVSKAIDKCNGEAGRLLKFTAWMRTTGLKAKQIDNALKEAGCISPTSNFAVHYFNDGQPAIPTADMWKYVRPLCGDVPAWVDELVERIEAEREVVGSRDAAVLAFAPGEARTAEKITLDITAPATDAAKQWQGWGTALKPALEPITVARKPLIGTVAENVLAHGTGAINVDGCRVETEDSLGRINNPTATWGTYGSGPNRAALCKVSGRWPANLIHDGSEEVVGLFPVTTSGKPCGTRKAAHHWSSSEQGTELTGFGDTGSAARFFYCAKASKADRDEGCEGMEEKKGGMSNGAQIHGEGYDKGQDIGLNRIASRRNHHPTVKPTALMRYLCRLVTPPRGIVLDPFMGSGSTGKAAILEGFNFIGIEREEEYLEIAKVRIKAAKAQRESQLL